MYISLWENSWGHPDNISFMQFSTKIDGFEQKDSQGFENSYNSYEQYPLEKFFIFTIYQNYNLALIYCWFIQVKFLRECEFPIIQQCHKLNANEQWTQYCKRGIFRGVEIFMHFAPNYTGVEIILCKTFLFILHMNILGICLCLGRSECTIGTPTVPRVYTLLRALYVKLTECMQRLSDRASMYMYTRDSGELGK